MDIFKLLESLDFLGYSGICVGIENSQLLKNSLLILQKENHFRKCYYWGRINGARQDYHIAFGFKKDCLNDRIFYYSMDCINWLLLQEANKSGLFLSPLAINRFEGEPSIVANVYDINPPFPPNQDLKQYYDGPLPKELKEGDRLAATVELIIKDAVVVPRGAWLKCPNGIIIENPGFEGLGLIDALNLKSYLHARSPQQKWTTNLLTRHDYDYAIDFLDPIDSDVPKGCWNLQVTNCKRAILLHSYFWPGMVFYCNLNTPDYGFLYVGDGKKNMDVPFMV